MTGTAIAPLLFPVREATHDGESNFQVSLEDDSEFGENFINQTGSFDGAQAELVDEGEYLLDVNADGDWEGEQSYSFDEIGWIDINADGEWSVELD
jgi:hypothetical protein